MDNVVYTTKLNDHYSALIANKQAKPTKEVSIFTTLVYILTLQWFFLFLIYFYKLCISPILPKTCIYCPTCSTYVAQVVKEFGIVKGSALGLRRLLSCHPFAVGGVDNVPDNINGVIKWLL